MHPLIRTARTTGFLYLALGIAGALGFLLIRQQLFVPDDAGATLANLLERESLARLGIALEICIVLSQALAALWFFRLFRSVDAFAAGAVAVFGLVNAIAILGSAAFLATALRVAVGAGLPVAEGTAAPVQLMYLASEGLWNIGGLFFGLWLVPMGWLVLHSGWMPRPMGWILIAGGVGYVLGTFVNQLFPDAGMVADALAYLATVGEFWMIGYLLFLGVRPSALETAPGDGVPTGLASQS